MPQVHPLHLLRQHLACRVGRNTGFHHKNMGFAYTPYLKHSIQVKL
jgi:hypothetical protein